MSEDEYGGDEIFNSAFLNEVEAIEMGLGTQLNDNTNRTSINGQTRPAQSRTRALVSQGKPKEPTVIGLSSDDFDITFNFSESELAIAEQTATSATTKQPIAGPSRLARQTTLTGEILPITQPKSSTPRQFTRTQSASRSKFGRQPSKTKKWDHTEFAKTGARRSRSAKGKGKQGVGDEPEQFDEEDDGFMFEQFPAPYEYSMIFNYPLQLRLIVPQESKFHIYVCINLPDIGYS